MKKISILLAVVAMAFTACKTAKYPGLADGLYADIETNRGKILVSLDYKTAPITVANFVSLAEGNNPLLADSLQNKPFYEGIIFHRVMKDFMIQGGDPKGNGTGDAGYKFDDEMTELNHNEAGVISMANSGPNTNGSQFFITHVPYPSLNGRHAVFGKVVASPADEAKLRDSISDEAALKKAIEAKRMEIVDLIAKTEVSKEPQTMNKPLEDVVMNKIEIIRQGSDAKAFNAVDVFNKYLADKEEKVRKREEITANTLAKFNEQKAKATELPSGLKYYISEKGTGPKLTPTSKVKVHYAVYFADGKLLQTSNLKTAEALDVVDPRRKAANQYQPIQTEIGPDARMIAGFKEALQQLSVGDKATAFLPYHLAYGERGNRGIPPKSDLVFELEVVSAE